MQIHIITTGGTFDKVYYDALSEFTIGDPMADSLLEDAGVVFSWTRTSLLKKDSLELTDEDRQLLKEAVLQSPADRVLIVHGTDTMAQSAVALGTPERKTVVFTGAMQPARMLHSDAPFNLGFALGALQCMGPGVYIAMNGQVFAAGEVQKNRLYSRFERL